MLAKLLDFLIAPDFPSWVYRYDRAFRRMACVLAVLGGQLVFSGLTEGYCWVCPSIGTRFASDYSEWRFGDVRPGMTKAQVVSLLGAPLGRNFHGPSPSGHARWEGGDEVWNYSSDSSARGGDWAWLSREVVFRENAVVQTVRWTYYD